MTEQIAYHPSPRQCYPTVIAFSKAQAVIAEKYVFFRDTHGSLNTAAAMFLL